MTVVIEKLSMVGRFMKYFFFKLLSLLLIKTSKNGIFELILNSNVNFRTEFSSKIVFRARHCLQVGCQGMGFAQGLAMDKETGKM